MSSEKKDFFVSYNKADVTWAEWIAWQLEEDGYTTVLQAWDFGAGSNFVEEMDKATIDAERTIAVLSPNYLESKFTRPEWQAAFAQDSTGENRKLVPIRVREGTLEGLLAQVVYIDIVGRNEFAARNLILTGVRQGRGKPDSRPRFPGPNQRSVSEKPDFPGGLPPIWSVPHLRNPHFTGRESLLDRLHASLTSGETAAVTQAIAGLGGVGKTQLATEYAYRHASEYDIVWWVRSETSATLASDYAALATQLGLPEKDQTDQNIIVEAVRLWLGQNTGWLLVLDNAESADQVRDYIPQGATGHVLITSRNQIWGVTAIPLQIEVFKRSESVDFLQRRTGTDGEKSAHAVADALGDLPLALEQAAAYMDEASVTLEEYLKLFEEHQQRLLDESEPSDDYPFTVATTWSLSFQKLEEESPEGADLLRLLAFFAPDDIPRSLITEGEEHLSESLKSLSSDSLVLNNAQAALRRYSLIEMSEDSYSMHRLVQAVVRDSLSSYDRKTYARDTVILVDSAFNFDRDDLATWDGSTRLLPHALTCTRFSAELGISPETTVNLLNGVGKYFLLRADFGEAKTHFERVLRINEEGLGPEHPNVAENLNDLGITLRYLADLPSARSHIERALRIGENTLGPEHPEVAISLSNLGYVLLDQGDLRGARTHLERALRIGEITLGHNHPNVAIRLSKLGAILSAQGDLRGARVHLERALRIGENTLGHSHPEVAVWISNLGSILKGLGDLEGARTHYERAFKIFQDTLGDDHLHTQIVHRHLEDLDS